MLGTNVLSRPGVAATGRLLIRGPDGAVTEARTRDQLAAQPLVYGRGRIALLRSRASSRPGSRTRLSVSFGTTAAPVAGRPRVLATLAPDRSGSVGAPAIAASAQGEVAVAWVEFLQRRPDRGPGHPPTPGRRPAHRGFGPAQTLGPNEGVLHLSAEMARTGRAVVAWGTQDGGEEAGMPYRVRAAIRAPGAARFGRAQVLDPGGSVVERPAGAPELGLGPDGSATIAWSNIVGNMFHPVLVVTAGPNTRFLRAVQLAPNGAVGDVAYRGDGTAIVVWGAFTELGLDNQVQTALRPLGARAFGAAENVTVLEQTLFSPARAAFDPTTGRPAVVWSRQSDPGPGPPVWFSSRTP